MLDTDRCGEFFKQSTNSQSKGKQVYQVHLLCLSYQLHIHCHQYITSNFLEGVLSRCYFPLWTLMVWLDGKVIS